jgi:hypothetical protein
MLMGEVQTRCPRRPLLEHPREFSYWLDLYRDYKNGILPDEGGRLAQAAIVLEMFQIMDHTYYLIEEYKDQQRKRKALNNGEIGRPRG